MIDKRRICAALKAVEGIPVDALEQGVVDDLLTTLKTLLAAWDAIPDDEVVPEAINEPDLWETARDLLDRAHPLADLFDDLSRV